MRVAVCFSGQGERLEPLALAQQLQMYKNYGHIDMFFSLWDANRPAVEATIQHIARHALNGSYQLYFEWLPPIESSPLVHTKCHAWCEHYPPLQWYSQYSGVKNANLFRQKHNNNYDLVVRSRHDIGLAGNVDFVHWHNLLNDNDVIFPRSWNWRKMWNSEGGLLNDQFFIAHTDKMDQITCLVDRIDEYIDQGCRFHGESMMWWNITKGCSFKYHFGDFDTVLRGRIENN
jgi:hypothetical protein